MYRLIIIMFHFSIAYSNSNGTGIHKAKIIIGEKAPAFEVDAIDGQKINLKACKGSMVLLAFIEIKNPSQTNKSSETTALLTFLKSMKRQYEGQGLKIILADVAASSTKDELLNFWYDNGLETIPFIAGEKLNSITQDYEVHVFPSTFLIDKNGFINQIWEHVALSSQIAIAMNSLLAVRQNAFANELDTKAQTIFPGFTLARKLCDEIWMADDGIKWNTKNTPVRFLVLNDKDVQIKLEAINNATGEQDHLLDTVLAKLPDDESKILLQNMPAKYKSICGGLFSLSLKTTGQYILKATVCDKKSSELLFTGTANISVE